MSETITVNGLAFQDNAEFGFVATIAHASHDYMMEHQEHALLMRMDEPKNHEECVRLIHGQDEFELDGKEELALACFLAARNPDEVRRFLDILQSGPEVVEEIKRLERLCGGEL